MENPIERFENWWQEALANSPLQQKSAVCVSTIDENGFPTGRFVDLKSVSEKGFVFGTYLDSPKGKHIIQNPNTALTAWWDHVGYQVRIQGIAEKITDSEADILWKTRSRTAQLTTTAFEQSEPMNSENELETRLKNSSTTHAGQLIPRPDNWSGYRIKPISIEFLTFRETRLHLRERFERQADTWTKQLLQP